MSADADYGYTTVLNDCLGQSIKKLCFQFIDQVNIFLHGNIF
jgi:hypothetical protein